KRAILDTVDVSGDKIIDFAGTNLSVTAGVLNAAGGSGFWAFRDSTTIVHVNDSTGDTLAWITVGASNLAEILTEWISADSAAFAGRVRAGEIGDTTAAGATRFLISSALQFWIGANYAISINDFYHVDTTVADSEYVTKGYVDANDTIADGSVTGGAAGSGVKIAEQTIIKANVDSTTNFTFGAAYKINGVIADSEFATVRYVMIQIEDSLNEYSLTSAIVLRDGSQAMTADWAYGNFDFTGADKISSDTIAVGSTPSPLMAVANFATAKPGYFMQQADVHFGDSLSGMISFGTQQLACGTSDTTYNGGLLDLGNSIILRNGAAPDRWIEYAFIGSSDNIRWAIPSEGAGFATYNPRSMIHAGPAVLNDSIVYAPWWGFTKADFATDATGADLGVQDDLEVMGKVYLDTIDSRSDTKIVVQDTIDGVIDKAVDADSAVHADATNQVHKDFRNNTGATLDKGTAVYITGWLTDFPTVDSARADDAAKMPAVGLVAADVANNTTGFIV
ncbi:MAG: hypothetical protein KAJ19_21855, partial [Gammaproteobacteria bacterium]|nr:hypothetical protein [Gammaproteobacteria bacterium]